MQYYRHIIAFVAAALIGGTLFFVYQKEAFPEASIEVTLSRDDAVAESRAFLKGMGFDLAGYRSVTVFTKHQDELDYIERNIGLERAGELFRTTTALWCWRVRWFKEMEAVEYRVDYTPEGRLARFRRRVPEEAKGGEELTDEEARALGERFLRETLRQDPARLEFIEHHDEELPGRVDRRFVWRLRDFDINGAQYRYAVSLQGDRVAGFSQQLNIPETWTRERALVNAQKSLLGGIDGVLVFLLNGLAFGLIFWRAYHKDIRWRKVLALATIVSAVTLLSQLNGFPTARFDQPTTASSGVFWTMQLLSIITAVGLGFIGVFVVAAPAESLGRRYLSDRPHCTTLLPVSVEDRAGYLRRIGFGYCFGLASLGYVTIFYVFGQRWLDVWTPVDVPIRNSFSAYFPSLYAVQVGLTAAVTEEFTFRLFSIALLLRLTKSRWVALLLPAIIWGFAHTGYPQEPIWIRGVELTLSGVVYGMIFLRFGLITTIVSHYSYNCFIGVLPQFQTSDPILIAGAIIALMLPIFFGIVVVAVATTSERLRRLSLSPPPAGQSSSFPPDESKHDARKVAVSNRAVLLVALSAAAIWAASALLPLPSFFGKPPPIRMNRTQAAEIAAEILKAQGVDPSGYTSFTTFTDGTEQLPAYAIDTFGPWETAGRYGEFYRHIPTWTTAWYREKNIETYSVTVTEDGSLRSFYLDVPEEAPGARIDESRAKEIAENMLRSAVSDPESWIDVEVSKYDRPNRADYSITFENKSFAVGELKQRLSITVSGDRPTYLASPYYVSPEKWSRDKRIENTAILSVLGIGLMSLIGLALVVYMLVQFGIQIRKKNIRKVDLKDALRASLSLGVGMGLIEAINEAPAFYHGYFYNTEQSVMLYTALGILSDIGGLSAKGVGVFFVMLLAAVFLRAWGPTQLTTARDIVSCLHPNQWRGIDTIRNVLLGLFAAALTTGISRLESRISLRIAPDKFFPNAVTFNGNLNQLSASMEALTSAVPIFVAGLSIVSTALLLKHLLKKERWILLCLLPLSAAGGLTASSLPEGVANAAMSALGFAAIYLLATRAFRWNILAYAIWLWTADSAGDLSVFLRSIGSNSEIFLPAAQRLFWTAAPPLAILIIALIRMQKGSDVCSVDATREGR